MGERSATEIAAKQVRNLSAAVPDIQAGVNAVTENPCELAAANLATAKANYIAAIDSGKMERHLRAVSLGVWKSKTLAKVGRIAEGITEAEPTIVKFHAQRQPVQAAINEQLKAIPKRVFADSIRRMTVQAEEMHKWSFDKSL